MKMRNFALAIACAMGLAACDTDPAPQPDPSGPVIVDEECPRADGQPCK